MKKNQKLSLKYECGICGEKFRKSEVVKDPGSDTGWVCWDCRAAIHPEYKEEFE